MFVNDNGYGDDIYDVEGVQYKHIESLDSRLRKMKIIANNECVVIDEDIGLLSVVER